MSEIKDITDTEFNKLHVDLGELDLELNIVESRADGQDMSKELLGIVSAPTLSASGIAHHDERTAFGIDLCQGSSPFSYTRHLFAHPAFIILTYMATPVTKRDQAFDLSPAL